MGPAWCHRRCQCGGRPGKECGCGPVHRVKFAVQEAELVSGSHKETHTYTHIYTNTQRHTICMAAGCAEAVFQAARPQRPCDFGQAPAGPGH